ncbi:MAG: DUF2184 domain-containing protein [Gammaproteobacteria bacterium]|nr:DUF2184 domain-containing protein [Gammaproteobacteria bacterium]
MKIVQTYAVDETNVAIADAELVDFVINDAVENLINQGVFANDDEGVFFQRQLEYIQAQSFDVLYPELMGRVCFDLNTEGGEGINTITYRSYDKRGETAIIAGKATDLPRGDISGEEYSITVKTLGNAFGYSRQELAASKVTGMPLEARKAEATRKSYEEKVNQIIWFGSPADKLNGLFDGPTGAPCLTVQKTELANGVAGTPQWRTKTGTEVVKDLTDALAQVYIDTKKIFRPDTILMSVEDKLYLENTPISDEFPLVSIMKWFLENNKFIKSESQIKDVNELEGIYPATVGGTFDPTGGQVGGFTVYKSGADNARIREPFPYMHLPVQYKGLEFEVNCYGRFAGVEMIRPAAFQHFLNSSI